MLTKTTAKQMLLDMETKLRTKLAAEIPPDHPQRPELLKKIEAVIAQKVKQLEALIERKELAMGRKPKSTRQPDTGDGIEFKSFDAGEHVRYVLCSLPRCPKREGTDFKTTPSIDQGDDTRMQYVRCRNRVCGGRFGQFESSREKRGEVGPLHIGSLGGETLCLRSHFA